MAEILDRMPPSPEAQRREQEESIARSLARIRHKFLVMSGKGGVGKTSTAVNLAFALSERGRRVGLIVVVGLGAALALAIVNWLQNPDYAVLYRGLNESDAAAVTAKLREMGVNYRLADGGTTVLVPAA